MKRVLRLFVYVRTNRKIIATHSLQTVTIAQ